MKLSLLKAGCVVIYALALAGAAGLLPGRLGAVMQTVAAVMVVLHVLELVFMTKHVRLYKGSFAVSALLTLVCGILHWKPLADAESRGARGGRA